MNMKVKIRKKKLKTSKFFGFTDGDVKNAVKGTDYIKYGYPMEVRSKQEIAENNLVKDAILQIEDYKNNSQ